MRTIHNEQGVKRFLLHYITGTLALALTCACLLCILVSTAPAHASGGEQHAHAKAMFPQIPVDTTTPTTTVTSTPSPTVTTTPTTTVTSTPTVTTTPTTTVTSTPTVTITPSPTATKTPRPTSTANPSPTASGSATATASAQASPTATGSQTPMPGASSTSITTQGTGANQPPAGSPVATNRQDSQAGQGNNQSGTAFPFSWMLVTLGVVTLLGTPFLAGWFVLRKGLLPLSSPKLRPSGAAPWNRTLGNDALEQAAPSAAMLQASAPFPPGNGAYYRPDALPFGAWPSASSGSHAPVPFSATPLPTMPNTPVGYGAAPAFGADAQATASVAPNDPLFSSIQRSLESSNTGARKRLRRNELRTSDTQLPFEEPISEGYSADITALSDPHLQAMIQQYSQKERTVRQSP